MDPEKADSDNTSSFADDRRSSGWDIRNATKNYTALVLAHGATAFFSLASVWLITKQLGPEGYGGIFAFVAGSQLVQIFLNWSSTALARFGIEEFVKTGKITHSFWSRSFIFFPNLFLILFTGSLWISPLVVSLAIPTQIFWLLAVHILTSAIWLHIQFGLQGVKMLRLQGILLMMERVMVFTGIMSLIAVGAVSIENLLWCYIIPPVILTAVGIGILRPFVGLRNIYDTVQLKRMLMFSLPLLPFAIVGYLSTSHLDAFFITRYLSTRDLGIYAIAAQIYGMTLQLPIIANTVLLSMFVSLETRSERRSIQRYLEDVLPSATLIWSGACVGVAAFGSMLIPRVFGPDFEASAVPLFVLLLSSAIGAPIYFGYAAFSHAISASYVSMIASILAAIVNISLNFILIPRYGLVGCAIATFFSVSVCCAVVILLCHRQIEVPGRNLLISIVPIAVALAAVTLVNSFVISVMIFGAAGAVAALMLRKQIKASRILIYKGSATTSN
ncbi:MAG: polysaccharide biosynthesis C-terminal domain-containing protein [Acidobacteriota bacterium]|nr:MAG: polysaccharide biosynthesis C-terminal domain-containing protein [Acidobacteriota bacterium]